MSSDEKKIVGEKLKNAREEKGLSLQEVALALKISTKTLKAIEEGNEKNFPAKTFLRGFIQSYASYLKLDVNEILASFYEEFGSTRPKVEFGPLDPSEKPSAILQRESSRDPANLKTVALVGIGLILAIGIIISKKIIDKYQKEAETPSIESLQTVSKETPTPVSPNLGVDQVGVASVEEKSVDSGALRADEGARKEETSSETAAVNTSATHPPGMADHPPVTAQNATHSESVDVKPSVPKPEPAKVEPAKIETAKVEPAKVAVPKKETPKAEPAPKLETANVEKPKVNATNSNTATPPPPVRGQNLELIVEALDAVELEYLDGRGQPQKIKLGADQVHTFKSNAGLKLTVSNGGAVNLILNGKDIGIPGEIGKAKTLNY